MQELVGIFSRYYDHVLIDSPAGVGQGFLSAAASARRAMLVATPDPVCLRDTAQTRLRLQEAGVTQQRLIVNRFSSANFRAQGYYRDLDSVIDAAGVRLIAVIPDDPLLAAAGANAQPAPREITGSAWRWPVLPQGWRASRCRCRRCRNSDIPSPFWRGVYEYCFDCP